MAREGKKPRRRGPRKRVTQKIERERERKGSQKGKKAPEQSEGTSGRENLQNLSGTKLAHTSSGQSGEQKTGHGREGTSGRSEESLFPARPNQDQYQWEPPRTIESGLGRSPDGSDHRIDRLRLLGNGICVPTAELAWKTLWRKMNER